MTASTRKPVTEFILRVEITGLCLYLWDSSRKFVDFYMPDATARRKKIKHPDAETPVPHAGYIRFDLKDLDTGVRYREGELPDRFPSYEVVHRFQHEELTLQFPGSEGEGEAIEGEILLPDLGEFAPVLQVDPELGTGPHPEVLMHTRFAGGTFNLDSEKFVKQTVKWKIKGDFHPEQVDTIRELHGTTVWRRRVSGDTLNLVLSRVDGSGDVTVPLRAREVEGDEPPEIRLYLANLCENPLEWPELDVGKDLVADKDFKWLYRLLKLRDGYSTTEFPAHLCPVPEPLLEGDGNEGDLRDCFGLQATRP